MIERFEIDGSSSLIYSKILSVISGGSFWNGNGVWNEVWNGVWYGVFIDVSIKNGAIL